MYTRGATSVRCSCCHTVNLAPGTVYLFVARQVKLSGLVLISVDCVNLLDNINLLFCNCDVLLDCVAIEYG